MLLCLEHELRHVMPKLKCLTITRGTSLKDNEDVHYEFAQYNVDWVNEKPLQLFVETEGISTQLQYYTGQGLDNSPMLRFPTCSRLLASLHRLIELDIGFMGRQFGYVWRWVEHGQLPRTVAQSRPKKECIAYLVSFCATLDKHFQEVCRLIATYSKPAEAKLALRREIEQWRHDLAPEVGNDHYFRFVVDVLWLTKVRI
ncbi:hypothetical protein BT63DRAFT_451140 [Microthyrium microscopicum]|uniref:Uncharacterized protein n=1 Tax=Microthyrium microscopicum TaxID=703497 RepID=A0A6A6UPT9_9PEZI|nr:hypothetical protein BT63DRAFT_451140 [Microthyrium microscopicum]